jgi:hypothetical protein
VPLALSALAFALVSLEGGALVNTHGAKARPAARNEQRRGLAAAHACRDSAR